MAVFKTGPVTVGNTPTPLTAGLADDPTDSDKTYDVVVFNESAQLVRVGGADVAMSGATRGLPIKAGEGLAIDAAAAPVYAICASGTADCTVGAIGVV